MEYTYFVSYSFNQGFGMTEIFRDKPVKTFADVNSMANAIKEKHGYDVVIINWKLMNE